MRAALLTLASIVTPASLLASPPAVNDTFWKHWGDGKAEIAAYDLTFTRYGAPRSGTAVAIFVTETFSYSQGVKSDTHTCCTADELPVLKLNLVRDFPTGVYDYNLMTSSWIALTDHRHYRPGHPVKVSFSAQEWCGHAYHQVRFNRGEVASTSHSYFQGEADRSQALPSPARGISEDTLLLWARGLAAPVLQPGESVRVPALRSLTTVRLTHVPLLWGEATLRRLPDTQTVQVPAGTFEVSVLEAKLPDGTYTYDVERAWPHRVIRWTASTGETASLVGVERLPYWELTGPGQQAVLEKLGLRPRGARMP